MSALHATTSRGKYGNASSPAHTLICLISNYAQLPVVLTPLCAWGKMRFCYNVTLIREVKVHIYYVIYLYI